MFDRTLDTEHVFGHDRAMESNDVRRRRRSPCLGIALTAVLLRPGGGGGRPAQARTRGAARANRCVVVRAARRHALVDRRAGPPGADPRAMVDADRQVNGSVDAGAARARAVARHAAPRLTTHHASVPFAPPQHVVAHDHAMPLVRCRRRPRGRFPVRRRRRGHPTPARVSGLRAPVHVVRACRGRGPGRHQARRLRDPFDRAKLEGGILKAIKNRPVSPSRWSGSSTAIEERLRRKGPEVPSQASGSRCWPAWPSSTRSAYMRFASVYKDFQEITDFQSELDCCWRRRRPPSARATLVPPAIARPQRVDIDPTEILHVVVDRNSRHIILTSGGRQGSQSPSPNHTDVILSTDIHTVSTSLGGRGTRERGAGGDERGGRRGHPRGTDLQPLLHHRRACTRSTRSNGRPATRSSRTTRRAASPSSSATWSSRSRGRRTPPTSSPRSTSAARSAPRSASPRSAR